MAAIVVEQVRPATATLASREIPPEPPAPVVNPNPNMEITYTGNTGNDMGIYTMGFRSAKYNPSEWHESNYAKYYQSFVDRDNAERVIHESKRTAKEAIETTNKTQAEATKKLAESAKNIEFWKYELNREISDVIDETDLLLAQKKRLENALRATEIPLHIATDNLNCRQRRLGVDLVQDDVEISLLKEVEIINNVQDLLKNTINQCEKQIRLNRDAKQNLEMDWSDKKEALEIETKSGSLRNHHTNKQFHDGAAKFEEIQSTPESWAQFTHDNIARAEHERMASIQLRTLVDNVLDDTTRDMREQADQVDVNFTKRITEMEDAKTKLEENLVKVVKQVKDQEKNIEDLQKEIRDKEDPLKVAQTRLYNRTFRPGVELCRDPAQYHLVGEVNEINQSIDALKQKLNDAQNSLKDLQDNRMALEKEIAIKKNSIFIDRDKCLTVRNRFPSRTKLQGYQ
ncbi:tektin-4 [Biomphalaria glabrata]|uniref:Tektin n=1 Tax=Biomphalaria glabrata TaxID=6526 RepID=A0A2C9JZH2_BIOGL|nr:tektin-4-like [Biomphalaria glabrata]KAI8796600.1 tektin-4 [Biomphalaria glabrata]